MYKSQTLTYILFTSINNWYLQYPDSPGANAETHWCDLAEDDWLARTCSRVSHQDFRSAPSVVCTLVCVYVCVCVRGAGGEGCSLWLRSKHRLHAGALCDVYIQSETTGNVHTKNVDGVTLGAAWSSADGGSSK
eukprot:1142540-Pelagomonas_calceolata.AAC.9